MNESIILQALAHIRDLCIKSSSLTDVVGVMYETDLIIFAQNGYSILSYEFAEYLRNKHSVQISREELDAALPDIISKFGTRLEPRYNANNQLYCYKIFLT